MAPRRPGRALACVAAAAAVAAVVTSGPSFVTSAPLWSSRSLRGQVALAAEGETPTMCYGSTLQKDGTWKTTEEGVPVEGPEEEAVAVKAWQEFRRQFKSAATRGMYMTTPVGEEDVKYRFRQMRDAFGISGEETIGLLATDALPMVIDSAYVKETFDAMVEGSSREKALEIITRHPGVLAAGKAIKDNMFQADIASNMIAATRPLTNLLASNGDDDN